MDPDALDGTRWALEYLNLDGVSHLVTGRAVPEIAFEDGRVSVDDGVNRGKGTYHLEGTALRLGPLGATRKAYPPDRLPEHDLFEHLAGATEAVLRGDFLHLRFEGGELVYRWEDGAVRPA